MTSGGNAASIRVRGGVVVAVILALAVGVGPVRATDPDTYVPAPKQSPKAGGKPAPKDDKRSKPAPDADRLKKEAEGLFGPKGQKASPAEPGGEAVGPGGWAVVLGVFRGEGAKEEAAAQLARVRGEGGLPEAYTVRRNEAYVIAVGDFAGPSDARAQAELRRIQGLEFGGGRAFPQAFLAPPADGVDAGEAPKLHLLRAREQFGAKAVYTLQVAVYCELDAAPTAEQLREFRAKAEEAAYKLRQEGELAFYYHTRDMSMVTVGVFDTTDFDPQVPGYKSPRLREAQKRHPLNLVNGHELLVKRKGGAPVKQPSNLVAVPDR